MLTQYLSWRCTLYVNLVFAVIAIVGALAYMRSARPATRPRMDWPGAVLASPQLLDRLPLLRDHRVPGGTRRATRRRWWQNGHNQPSLPPALSNQDDTLGQLGKDRPRGT